LLIADPFVQLLPETPPTRRLRDVAFEGGFLVRDDPSLTHGKPQALPPCLQHARNLPVVRKSRGMASKTRMLVYIPGFFRPLAAAPAKKDEGARKSDAFIQLVDADEPAKDKDDAKEKEGKEKEEAFAELRDPGSENPTLAFTFPEVCSPALAS
jgi:hypothetical protein